MPAGAPRASAIPGVARRTMAEDPLSLLCIEPHFPGRLGADRRLAGAAARLPLPVLLRHRRPAGPLAALRRPRPGGDPVQGRRRGPRVGRAVDALARTMPLLLLRLLRGARRPPAAPVDLVLGRSASLGSTLFAPVALPAAPVVNLFDYWMAPHANDLADEIGPGAPPSTSTGAAPPTPTTSWNWRAPPRPGRTPPGSATCSRPSTATTSMSSTTALTPPPSPRPSPAPSAAAPCRTGCAS